MSLVAFKSEIGLSGEASPARPVLSADEREKRLEAVRYAAASVGLEGFQLTDAAKARTQRFVDGDINLAEFLREQ